MLTYSNINKPYLLIPTKVNAYETETTNIYLAWNQVNAYKRITNTKHYTRNSTGYSDRCTTEKCQRKGTPWCLYNNMRQVNYKECSHNLDLIYT